jgi:hypothetical protein
MLLTSHDVTSKITFKIEETGAVFVSTNRIHYIGTVYTIRRTYIIVSYSKSMPTHILSNGLNNITKYIHTR